MMIAEPNALPELFEIEAFMAAEQAKDLLRISTAGSVDDGKSTLIGRLLHDARGAYEDQLRSVRQDNGLIDFALLTDGLRAEREQGITIDVAYRYFATPRRKFILADTPGHVQYTRNMATGASTASLAIILADAYRGFTAQSRRHAYIAALLGIRHIVIAVNKMDLVDFDQRVFDRIRDEFAPLLDRLGVRDPYFLPVSALQGDNIVEPSARMPWFDGPALLEHLETVDAGEERAGSFRMPVQRVSRPDASVIENMWFRGYAGQIVSGSVRVGDKIASAASGMTTRVKRIVTFDGDLNEARAPMSVTLTLEDEIDISRGDMLGHIDEAPRTVNAFEANLVWFNARPLDPARDYLLKHTTQTIAAYVEKVQSRVNMETLESDSLPSDDATALNATLSNTVLSNTVLSSTVLNMNDIGRVSIRTALPLYVDAYRVEASRMDVSRGVADRFNRATGSFILIDRETNATVAGGMIL
jgi:sulfate adenylyltransferase large subunit